jgi:hypothetical protein
MHTRLLQFLGIALFLTGLFWQVSGCLPGNLPNLDNYCQAYKACKCRDLFGDTLNDCGKGVDQETNNSPSDRSKDEWCRDLYESSKCYQAYPQAQLNTPTIGSDWIKGKCAGAVACCLQIATSTDRKRCLSKFENVTNENRCVELASELGISTQGCNPTTPGGKAAPIPRPKPEPSPEPNIQPDAGDDD